MRLVHKDAHDIKHTGGEAIYEEYFGGTYK
jgi:hypothetical protein